MTFICETLPETRMAATAFSVPDGVCARAERPFHIPFHGPFVRRAPRPARRDPRV